MTKLLIALALIGFVSPIGAAAVVDFESIHEFVLDPEDYDLAGDHGGFYTSGNALFFGYHYTDPWDYWGGFGASNRTVVGANDIFHEYTSAPGTDHTTGPGGTYAVAYSDWESSIGCLIEFTENVNAEGAWFTNNAWTVEYTNENYDENDYYRLTVTAYDASMKPTGHALTVDLTGVTDWRYANMGFANVRALGITMASSDDWTPFYFCVDDIVATAVPEPSAVAMLASALLALISFRRGT